MENKKIKILRNKLLESCNEQYTTNLKSILKFSRHSGAEDAFWELSRSELLFMSLLQALSSRNIELSLSLMKEVDLRKLFPRITFYMGGKLHAEFDLPTEVLENALKFATSLKKSRLAQMPDSILCYLRFLVKRWKGVLPSDERLVSTDETFNISETGQASQFLKPRKKTASAFEKDIDSTRTKRRSRKSGRPHSQPQLAASQLEATPVESLPQAVPDHLALITSRKAASPKAAQEFTLDPIANALVTSTSIYSQATRGRTIEIKDATRDLFFGIGRNDPVATQLAVQLGADLEEKSADGFSPIHLAARGGCERIMNILIQSGADLNTRNRTGCTPLHLAVVNGNDASAILLINCKADVNVKDNYGITPLHEAAARGRLKVIQYLVRNGAHINSMTNCRETPLALALLWNQQHTAAYLREIGGTN